MVKFTLTTLSNLKEAFKSATVRLIPNCDLYILLKLTQLMLVIKSKKNLYISLQE